MFGRIMCKHSIKTMCFFCATLLFRVFGRCEAAWKDLSQMCAQVDDKYEKLMQVKVERSTDELNGTLLPYLANMSPSPTFANLSKVVDSLICLGCEK